MAHLINAPVVYVIGVWRFPRLVDFAGVPAAIQRKLRKEYPHYENLDAPHFHVDVDADGTVNMKRESVVLHQYAAPDRKSAVFVHDSLVAFHTIAYRDHADFFDRFLGCVDAIKSVDEVEIEYVDQIGLRYVDLITPNGDDRLEDYLVEGVLPSDIKGVDGLQIQDGVSAARYRTASGRLRLQALRRPPMVLPPELQSPMTVALKWDFPLPTGDFAVLDTDHGTTFEKSPRVNELNFRDVLTALRAPISDVFKAVTTEHASRVWAGEAG